MSIRPAPLAPQSVAQSIDYLEGLTEGFVAYDGDRRRTYQQQALDKGEFVLHYQPKVNSETRRIDGVEALIRWRSPELGRVLAEGVDSEEQARMLRPPKCEQHRMLHRSPALYRRIGLTRWDARRKAPAPTVHGAIDLRFMR